MDKRVWARSGCLVRICSCVNGRASFPASFLGAYLIWMSGVQDFAEGRDKQAAQKCMCTDTGLGRWCVWDGSGGQQLLCSALPKVVYRHWAGFITHMACWKCLPSVWLCAPQALCGLPSVDPMPFCWPACEHLQDTSEESAWLSNNSPGGFSGCGSDGKVSKCPVQVIILKSNALHKEYSWQGLGLPGKCGVGSPQGLVRAGSGSLACPTTPARGTAPGTSLGTGWGWDINPWAMGQDKAELGGGTRIRCRPGTARLGVGPSCSHPTAHHGASQ